MTAPGGPELGRALARVRRLAALWDEAVRIPILGRRVGLDALVGLVPGVGDVVGLAVSLYPLLLAAGLGAGVAVVARMALNVGIDAAVGAIPLLGDVFDVAWKANSRNRDLLESWAVSPESARRRSRLTLGIAGGLAAGLVVAATWGLASLIGWLRR